MLPTTQFVIHAIAGHSKATTGNASNPMISQPIDPVASMTTT